MPVQVFSLIVDILNDKTRNYWHLDQFSGTVACETPIVLSDLWKDSSSRKVDFSASSKCLRIRALLTPFYSRCRCFCISSLIICPVLAVSCSPVLAVLCWPFYPCCIVLAVLSWLSCLGRSILAVLSWPFYPGCLFLAVLSWLSCLGRSILAVLSLLI